MSHNAQEELEKRSLRNVRALLDKLEAEAATERRSRKWLALSLVACALVLVGAFYYMGKERVVTRTVVSQPAGRVANPPAEPAPAPATANAPAATPATPAGK